jgi:toxin HigB-1
VEEDVPRPHAAVIARYAGSTHQGSMIESIKHKGLKLFFEHGDGSKLPPEMLSRIRRILAALDAAPTVEFMSQPTLRLHPLKGKLKGYWAVTVRANWRITFAFDNGRAKEVDFVDYH